MPEQAVQTSIRLTDVSKTYRNGTSAVAELSLDIEAGEFFVLLGPSGSGKSTLLRMIAGLEELNSGSVHFGDTDVSAFRPRDRDVAMVFQNYALYPHLSVADNLAFGLRRRAVAKQTRIDRVDAVAESLGITELLGRRPAQLSGGQRQRVALGRAIARSPRLFLMDEPLSNLDASLRTEMRGVLGRLHQDIGVTSVYVTHDQTEAMTLGARIGIMKDAHLVQVGTPEELYERPVNLFVASFIGTPRMNIFRASARSGNVQIGAAVIPLPTLPALASPEPQTVYVGIRPDDLEDGAVPGHDDWPRLTARIELREYLGAECLLYFAAAAEQYEVEEGPDEAAEGAAGSYAVKSLCCAQVSASSAIRTGSEVQLAIDPTRIYVFDAAGQLLSGPAARVLDGPTGTREGPAE